MYDLFIKQVNNNYSVIVFILTFTEKRYDLFFKMVGGQNGSSYRQLKDYKNNYYRILDNKSFDGLHLVLNPDGKICKNHYLLAIALITGFQLEVISKKIAYADIWETNEKWLQETFNQDEIKYIKFVKEKWTNKIMELKKS